MTTTRSNVKKVITSTDNKMLTIGQFVDIISEPINSIRCKIKSKEVPKLNILSASCLSLLSNEIATSVSIVFHPLENSCNIIQLSFAIMTYLENKTNNNVKQEIINFYSSGAKTNFTSNFNFSFYMSKEKYLLNSSVVPVVRINFLKPSGLTKTHADVIIEAYKSFLPNKDYKIPFGFDETITNISSTPMGYEDFTNKVSGHISNPQVTNENIIGEKRKPSNHIIDNLAYKLNDQVLQQLKSLGLKVFNFSIDSTLDWDSLAGLLLLL